MAKSIENPFEARVVATNVGYFLREFSISKTRYTPPGRTEIEFADQVILIGDSLFLTSSPVGPYIPILEQLIRLPRTALIEFKKRYIWALNKFSGSKTIIRATSDGRPMGTLSTSVHGSGHATAVANTSSAACTR